MIKGFALDDERLKQGGRLFGKGYFEELLERIREIRASERRFYQKVTDIYALSMDYDRDAPLTEEFFATVQNKLHWAITGETAAEIIYSSADASKLHKSLTTWKHSPDGKILKSDVAVAKNYLNEAHIAELNRIVSAYLDLAQSRSKADCHPDAGMGAVPARVPGTLTVPDPQGQGESHRTRTEAESRAGIRDLSQAAGHRIRFGF
jgi:hypothetical protein